MRLFELRIKPLRKQVSAGQDHVVLDLRLADLWSVVSTMRFTVVVVLLNVAASLAVQHVDIVRVCDVVVVGRRRWLVLRWHPLVVQFSRPEQQVTSLSIIMKTRKSCTGQVLSSAKYRPTRVVVDAALRRIGKSRHGGHKIANISVNNFC